MLICGYSAKVMELVESTHKIQFNSCFVSILRFLPSKQSFLKLGNRISSAFKASSNSFNLRKSVLINRSIFFSIFKTIRKNYLAFTVLQVLMYYVYTPVNKTFLFLLMNFIPCFIGRHNCEKDCDCWVLNIKKSNELSIAKNHIVFCQSCGMFTSGFVLNLD